MAVGGSGANLASRAILTQAAAAFCKHKQQKGALKRLTRKTSEAKKSPRIEEPNEYIPKKPNSHPGADLEISRWGSGNS